MEKIFIYFWSKSSPSQEYLAEVGGLLLCRDDWHGLKLHQVAVRERCLGQQGVGVKASTACRTTRQCNAIRRERLSVTWGYGVQVLSKFTVANRVLN